jgi:hypothetical protein
MDLQILNIEDEFNPERIEICLKNTGANNKPANALWTSSIIKENGLITSGWLEWCDGNQTNFIERNTYVFTPKDNLKIYTIDSVEDYANEELSKFIYNPFPRYAYTPYRAITTDKEYDKPRCIYNYIDYQAMADKGYDGIHFTMNAAMIGHAFGWDYSMELYCIDCESTVWLTKNWWKDYELLRKETVKYGIQ